MNRKNGLRIVSILATIALVVSTVYFYQNTSYKTNAFADSNQELTLTRPTFSGLSLAASTYLEQEAGIAIYINTTDTIDLNAAKGIIINKENETSDYVIGSLKWGTISSDDYPHCFVHKDGWIVVYYLKINLANPDTTGWISKIIDWSDVSQVSLPVTSNLLYDGLYYIAQQGLGISIANATYYHFQFPMATTLLFAIKHATNYNTPATFNVKIPNTLTVYEQSWSCGIGDPYTFMIDSTSISHASGRHYGPIPDAVLTLGVFHTFSITANSGNYQPNAYVCLVVLYQ